MGCDGGTIPKRHELVKTAKKVEKLDVSLTTSAIYLLCALSKSPLTCPLVICALGKVYNKEAILEYLLNPKTYGDADKICFHIRSLKDVKPILFEHNPSFDINKPQGTSFPFICPITFKVLNGHYKFVYLSTCGHAFSETGLKEIKQTDNLSCPQCNEPYTIDDIKPIYPPQEEQDKILVEIMEKIKAKKEKKRARESQNEDKKSKKIKEKCSVEAPIVKLRTSAIKSIYSSSKAPTVEPNYLCKGTFSRMP